MNEKRVVQQFKYEVSSRKPIFSFKMTCMVSTKKIKKRCFAS